MAFVGLFLGGRAGARWGVFLTTVVGLTGIVVPILWAIHEGQVNPTVQQAVQSEMSVFSLDSMLHLISFFLGEVVGDCIALVVGSGRQIGDY